MIAQIDLKPEDLLQEHLAEGLFTPKYKVYGFYILKRNPWIYWIFSDFSDFFGFFSDFFACTRILWIKKDNTEIKGLFTPK